MNYLENQRLETVASMPQLRCVLVVGNGMNELDASGEALLSQLVTRLRDRGLDVYFSGLNDDVIDVMKRTHLLDKVGEDHFFNSVSHAVEELHEELCRDSHDHRCPLLHPEFQGLEIEDTLRKKLEKKSSWSRVRNDK